MTAPIPAFDYGSITDEHKSVVVEIASLLRDKGLDPIANELTTRFKIVEIPKFDLHGSPFVSACKEAGIHGAIQGYIQEGLDANAIQYPVVSICDDIRNLDKLIPIIKAMELNESNQ